MKVMLLHRDLVFDGGVGQCFLQYARRYDPRKVQLVVGGLDDAPNSLEDVLHEMGVPTVTLGGASYAKAAKALRGVIQREGLELIAATSLRAYLIAKAAVLGVQCRVVFWIHSIPLVIQGPIRRAMFRFLARRDTLIFVSEAVREAHSFPRHAGASYVVYNGVEDPAGVETMEPYPRTRRADLGIPHDALVIGFIGEFVSWKNHHVLLRAFAELARTRTHARLILIGSGPLQPASEALARELGLADRVIYTGRRRDARRLFGLMDIYAHPANGEGFGLSAVEAMLARLPVVAARAGALVEIVMDGDNGLFAEPDDVGSLLSALERLADDAVLRADLGERARRDCLARFSPSCYAANLTDALLALDEAAHWDGAETPGRLMKRETTKRCES